MWKFQLTFTCNIGWRGVALCYASTRLHKHYYDGFYFSLYRKRLNLIDDLDVYVCYTWISYCVLGDDYKKIT